MDSEEKKEINESLSFAENMLIPIVNNVESGGSKYIQCLLNSFGNCGGLCQCIRTLIHEDKNIINKHLLYNILKDKTDCLSYYILGIMYDEMFNNPTLSIYYLGKSYSAGLDYANVVMTFITSDTKVVTSIIKYIDDTQNEFNIKYKDLKKENKQLKQQLEHYKYKPPSSPGEGYLAAKERFENNNL